MPRTSKNRNFGARLRELRHARKMTLVALADQLGVSTASVWLWENRQRVPIASTVQRVAQIFGVDPSALMEPRAEAAAPDQAPPPDLQDLIHAIEAKGFRVQIVRRRNQRG